VAGLGERGQGVAGAVGGVGEHPHRPGDAGFVGQQIQSDGGLAVGRPGRGGQPGGGDQPGVRLDHQVRGKPVDATGFIKKGSRSARVGRQYTGTTGKVDNCQIGVFCAYTTPTGRALIDRELYLPRAWTDDRDRARAAGIGDEVGFATKPELARRMLQRTLDAEVPAG
jgi:hypothetical protein